MFAVDSSARVRAGVAPMHAEARVSAAQTSQVVAGRVVTLLAQHHDWWQVRSADAYEGWMHQGYLEPADGDEESWDISLGVTIRAGDDTVRALPVFARLAANYALVQGATVRADRVASMFPRLPETVTATARQLFAGTSYEWGGVTEWGADCSGLVQTVFALHGTLLPRDAYQQAGCGVPAGIEDLSTEAHLQRVADADLLFFSDREDRRITHVGIGMADGHLIHSALGRGGVRVEDLRSGDSYVQRLRQNFVLARRIWTAG